MPRNGWLERSVVLQVRQHRASEGKETVGQQKQDKVNRNRGNFTGKEKRLETESERKQLRAEKERNWGYRSQCV